MAAPDTEPRESQVDQPSCARVEAVLEDIRDKYELEAVIGTGSIGQVHIAHVKENRSEVRAVKVIERDAAVDDWSNQAMWKREVTALQAMNHENIVKIYDVYEDSLFFYIVMEVCHGGEMFDKLIEQKRFSEKDAVSMARQMLQAIEYIHGVNIVHRDIKAENFMLSTPEIDSQIKLLDFGMACRFEHGEILTEICGSPHYLSPELIGQGYSYPADLWAFGVLVFILMYGHYPYDARHPRDIMVKILTEPIRWQTKAKLSVSCLDFLKGLLQPQPKLRLDSTQALNHAWITGKIDGTDDLPTEVIRSAHRKLSASRKQVDPRVNQQRSDKLKKLHEDWKKGIAGGRRLAPARKEAYLDRPEHLRRANRLSTAPSRTIDIQFAVEALDAATARNQVSRRRCQSATSRTRVLHEDCQLTVADEQRLIMLYKANDNEPSQAFHEVVPGSLQ